MSLVDNIRSKVSAHFEKRREEKEFEHQLEREQRQTEKLIYKQEFRKASLEVAMIRAKQDAESKTGLAKLRAINRYENLKKPKLGIFQKLHEYTSANIARTEENLRKTQMLRQAASEERAKSMHKPTFKYQPLVVRRD